MKVVRIIETQQPGIYKQLNKNRKQHNKKRRRGKKEDLSFSDYVQMMKHDSYKRYKGALRQR
ncbi:hypothetical protein EXM98_01110 [Clostridium botulinum]|uniref:hypothetical protein n=1 Tax=Clostridium botulinum TaxID=1491 RepID=UPI00046FED51|nr:hypothetical protein [Clostridium botulinum]AUN00954.1 hypothetical protein RSJ13_08700 [Clostridium botulinum]KEI87019.1 hypothetical protein N492_08345 [Clostridium botulinum B2 267]MBN3353469.1 hypothetical protein [Clostridium botulinum]MBY6799460.1 hypothetical protein [Clostridium botulinum]MBY6997206.1 hypothetical protein [Clostridium botulinum]